MQTGFITALQPFAVNGPQLAVRRADEPGQPPAEKLRDGQADRDRANERAARPAPGGTSRVGLVDASSIVAAQEAQSSDPKTDANGLTEEDRRVIAELKKRDREVRAHENAHKAAAGTHAGGISYTYQQGPDGKRYAVGGEVPIDISPVDGNPQATIRKMQQIRRAALAPAEPSGADRAVAAAATKALLQAQSEIAAERAEEISNRIQTGGDPRTAQPNSVGPEGASAATRGGAQDGKTDKDASVIGGRNIGIAEPSATEKPASPEAPTEPSEETRPSPRAPDLPYLQQVAGNDRDSGPSLSIVV